MSWEDNAMKLAKRFMIWAALMLAAAFCVNLIGTIMVKSILSDTLTPTMLGYSAKGEKILHPTPKEPDEKDKTNGLSGLFMRALLDDQRLVYKSFWGNFLFLNVTIDQTVILFEKDGMGALSKGVFADVYEDTGESVDHIRHTVGLLSVRDFCELDCAEEIYETLNNNPHAVLKVDSYSISEFLIQPASVTILNGDGNALGTFECPCSGEIIRSENTYIYDDNSFESENDLHGFCNKMTTAYLGERTSDKIAEKLVGDVAFENGDHDMTKSGFGFGHYISKSYDVHGNYAMIYVFDFNFITGVVMYIIIACIPITLLTFLIGRKKKNAF